MTRERDRIQENANKYMVKNCPAYITFYPDTGAEPFTACNAELPFKRCQDCTDCVIKQVIEKCKTIIEKDYKEEDRHLFSEDDLKILDRTWFDVGIGCKKTARQIIQLFDIEEINK